MVKSFYTLAAFYPAQLYSAVKKTQKHTPHQMQERCTCFVCLIIYKVHCSGADHLPSHSHFIVLVGETQTSYG